MEEQGGKKGSVYTDVQFSDWVTRQFSIASKMADIGNTSCSQAEKQI